MHIYQNKCCTRIHLQTLVNNSLWREGKFMQNHIPKMKSARPVRIILNWLSNEILKIGNWLHPLFLCTAVKCVPVLYRQLIQHHWLARISSHKQVYTHFSLVLNPHFSTGSFSPSYWGTSVCTNYSPGKIKKYLLYRVEGALVFFSLLLNYSLVKLQGHQGRNWSVEQNI